MKKLILFLLFSTTLEAQQYDSLAPTKTPKDSDDKAYTIVEEMPEYPGGVEALKKYLADNVTYPKRARKKRITGKCIVKFIVEVDGSVGSVEVLKGVENCPECDNEAIKAITGMPSWKPGKVDSRLVRVYFTIPIGFIIKD